MLDELRKLVIFADEVGFDAFAAALDETGASANDSAVSGVADMRARLADSRLAASGITNVTVRTGDGSLGWQEFAPYASVLAAAAAPHVPSALLDQLDEGGVLVAPDALSIVNSAPCMPLTEHSSGLKKLTRLYLRFGICRTNPCVSRRTPSLLLTIIS
jgi:hypothetical protein